MWLKETIGLAWVTEAKRPTLKLRVLPSHTGIGGSDLKARTTTEHSTTQTHALSSFEKMFKLDAAAEYGCKVCRW